MKALKRTSLNKIRIKKSNVFFLDISSFSPMTSLKTKNRFGVTDKTLKPKNNRKRKLMVSISFESYLPYDEPY